ncbi:MAG: AMP-binding protein [Gemmatimonadetes bacterium]|nr:AMP-binding protein [Gemmatimonadota bacterium]
MSQSELTVPALLGAGADRATALSSPGGIPLTHQALRSQIGRTVEALAARGIGPNDRVAIVLDSGPEMALAFLAITSLATAAPLNPGYRAEEFEFYLSDLGARLLILGRDKASPAADVAAKLGIPVARVAARPALGAGTFELEFESNGRTRSRSPDTPTEGDIALVLHTSGTTSRPKIVPLAHRNMVASAGNIRRTLGFTADDRGLCITSLFHIHGLMTGLLAPLSAGGEVCCTSGFNALKFFGWVAEVHPTWYTGVPTMHQAILGRASKNREVIRNNPLRFLRSSSSALPVKVIGELESVFDAPVIESYGMTEAAHQMASNPLPPRARKPGTVGPAAGPEMRVVDERGDPLPPGSPGEIVTRGENVMRGYENNPEANADAFIKGWFRTGDQGIMDADGYISITGRLKEIINRGGEKISPREVDEIIMEHPAVHQCVTFAVPHDMLGEDVAAAVVLRDGAQVSGSELRRFAAVHLADFKVPRKILIVPQIPVGATGKLQRIGLAQKLGLCEKDGRSSVAAPPPASAVD